eukprot:2302260-Pyramimonas_sp.AAC.1
MPAVFKPRLEFGGFFGGRSRLFVGFQAIPRSSGGTSRDATAHPRTFRYVCFPVFLLMIARSAPQLQGVGVQTG